MELIGPRVGGCRGGFSTGQIGHPEIGKPSGRINSGSGVTAQINTVDQIDKRRRGGTTSHDRRYRLCRKIGHVATDPCQLRIERRGFIDSASTGENPAHGRPVGGEAEVRPRAETEITGHIDFVDRSARSTLGRPGENISAITGGHSTYHHGRRRRNILHAAAFPAELLPVPAVASQHAEWCRTRRDTHAVDRAAKSSCRSDDGTYSAAPPRLENNRCAICAA